MFVSDPVSLTAWELEAQQEYHAHAIDSFKKSLTSDPQNPETLYLLALSYAEIRQTDAAIKCAKGSLLLSPDQADVWHLLTLLLSSQSGLFACLFNLEFPCLTPFVSFSLSDFASALKLCETGLQYDFADLGFVFSFGIFLDFFIIIIFLIAFYCCFFLSFFFLLAPDCGSLDLRSSRS